MDDIRTRIQVIKREIDRLRVRMYYLQRTAVFLEERKDCLHSDTVERPESALVTLNNLIDANVVFTARIGEFVSDAERVLKEKGEADHDAVVICNSLRAEIIDVIEELGEQRAGMDESVSASRELLVYFAEDRAA